MAVVSRFLSSARKAAKEKQACSRSMWCFADRGRHFRALDEGRYSMRCFYYWCSYCSDSQQLELRLSIDIPSCSESVILCFVFA
ncbi:MAG: hypothetical protein ACLT98_09105 [Eggerthellaceae bacterium]